MRRHFSALGALASTATGALAQECLWSTFSPAIPQATLLYDSINQRVLAFGNPFGSVRTLQGGAWIALPTVGAPSHGGPATYDSVRGRIVQHGGGYFPEIFSDTWEWDGLNWVLVAADGPAGTGALAFDAARNKTVLFHSVTGTGPGQTWLWDGSVWTMATWSGPPTGFSSMVYDPHRQRVILFSMAEALRGVWEWDGASWERKPDAPINNGGTPVYDFHRRRVLVHSANYLSVPQTWELDPATSQWTQRSFAGPSPGSMVYDIANERALLASSWQWRASGTIAPVYVSSQPANVQLPPGGTATFSVGAQGGGPIRYQWFKNQQPLVNGGHISGADTPTLRLDSVSTADVGYYSVEVANDCTDFRSTQASLSLTGGPCYANCDGSVLVPKLTANDFVCFFTAYVSGASYADCDGVGGNTAGDFICFLTRYNSGCP